MGFRLKMSRLLKIMLILAAVILLGNAAAISRDYQDSWILEGLEIPFILFVAVFVMAFSSEKKELSLVGLAVLARTVLLLIPNLKYVWFQGVYVDQHQQYNMASYVVATGKTLVDPTIASFSLYTGSPLLHILFSMFSIVPGIPVVDSVKYVPVLFSPIYPLLTHAIVKKIRLVQHGNILKYALFLSSIPIGRWQFTIGGVTLGIPLAFAVLFLLVEVLQKNDRRYWLVCVVFVIGLAGAHSATSIILAGILFLIFVLQRVPYFRPKSYLQISVVLTVGLIGVAWLMFPAYFNLGVIVRAFSSMVPTGTTPSSDYIPSTFFQLAHVEPLGAARTFLVYYGVDLFLLILALPSLIIMLKMRKNLSDASSFLMLFLGLTLVIMMLGVIIKLGPTRLLVFDEFLFPFFCGATIFYAGINRKWIRILLFGTIIVLATIEFYGCQPLIPSANSVYPELPANVPIGYVNDVNSIYQRQVASFAFNHVAGPIATDEITYNQILGVANSSFASLLEANYYAIATQNEQWHNILIIHVPGKAGILQEKANVRAPNLILQTMYNSDIVYTNGESYMLSHYLQP